MCHSPPSLGALLLPSTARALGEGLRRPHLAVCRDLLEVCYESAFAGVVATDLIDDRLPLRVLPELIIQPLGRSEMFQGKAVVLALASLENAHGQGAVDLRGRHGMLAPGPGLPSRSRNG